MRTSKKKSVTVLTVTTIVIITLTILSTIPSNNTPEEMPIQDRLILTLKDIAGLNLTEYNLSTSVFLNPFDQYRGSKVEDVKCNLQTSQGNRSITARFVNGTLSNLDLTSIKGAYTNQLPTNPIEASKILIDRLKKYYTNPSYLQPMITALDSATKLNTFNHTQDNIKQQATIHSEFIQFNQTLNYTSTYTQIRFTYIFGDANDSPKSLSFSFRDNYLIAFGNTWGLYKIGNQTINITKEQAINLAKELANNATDNELTLRNQTIRADLSLVAREPFTLYPYWFIELPLTSPTQHSPNSPTFIHSFTVWQLGIWADTGEIQTSHPA